MAGTNDSADVPEDSSDLRKKSFAFEGVGLHDLPLFVRQLARLVDDLAGNLDLADVVQERCELRVSALTGIEPHAVGDVDHERHHVAAVAARVGIVGLDDVSEQHRGASVGVAELECVVDANLALSCEVREQSDQRQRDDNQRGVGAASERSEDGDGRQGRVDGPDPDHETQEAPRRDTEAETVAQGRAPEVEGELGDQGQRVDRQVVRRRCGLAGRDEDERRADGMPGVHEPQEAAVDRDTAARVFGEAAEEQTCCDAERDVLHRKEGEHRHEDELRRDRRAGADLEVDPRSERIGGHEDDERPEPDLAGGVGKRCERDGDGQERAAEKERGEAVAIAERRGGKLPRTLDQGIGVDIYASGKARRFRARGIQSRPMPPLLCGIGAPTTIS